MTTQYDSGIYEVEGATLTEVIRGIITAQDPGEVVAAAISRIGTLVRADGAVVVVWSAGGPVLMGSAEKGEGKADVHAVGVEASAGIAGQVAATRQAVLLEDVRSDSRYEPAVDAPRGTTPRSLVAVPLTAHGELLGVLQAVREEGRRPFSVNELRLLEMVAPHVAIAVFNALALKHLREARVTASTAQLDLELKVQQRTALLIKAKREWESTVDSISEPLALLSDLTVTRANLAYGRQANADIREVPGNKCFTLLAGRRSPCPGCPVVGSQGVERRQAEVRLGDQHFEVSTFPTGADDGSVVVHYRDVTEHRRLEARLRQTERLAALGQLASGAAHEINNPLGSVMSNLRSISAILEELRASGTTLTDLVAVSGDLQAAAADAIHGASRVAAIVRALRTMSRQNVGEPEVVNLKDSVTRAMAAALVRDVTHVVTDFSIDARARVVPLLLDQALTHVLANARQAVEGDERITLTTGVSGDEAWVRVKDEGAGIAPDDLPRIFEPFFTTRGVGGGIGLGLSAAWSIVSGFGGHIDVESSPGHGSTFTLRLPRAVEAAPQRRSEALPLAEGSLLPEMPARGVTHDGVGSADPTKLASTYR